MPSLLFLIVFLIIGCIGALHLESAASKANEDWQQHLLILQYTKNARLAQSLFPQPTWHTDQIIIKRRQKLSNRFFLRYQFENGIHRESLDNHYSTEHNKKPYIRPKLFTDHNPKPKQTSTQPSHMHHPLRIITLQPHTIDMTSNTNDYDEIISNYLSSTQPILARGKNTAIISLAAFLVMILLIASMVLAMRLHYRSRERDGNQWINHPAVRPSTAAAGTIQPGYPPYLPTSEPIRIKAKGLLERRGSNTSLTIDLGSTGECADAVFSPARECTPEDFLLTAGSRMSRQQLRQCLRNAKLLHTEFWQIPSNHPERCSVAGAASKNRYRTVLPNEESRVILHKAFDDSPEIPSSQYINANYIRGYDGEEKAYIATQGPLAHTIEDLWILVLQMKSPAIVMITRLKEKGRLKCEPYIPTYAASYGSIHVTVKQVIQKNGYTIRQILVKRGEDVHTTLHFWFTSWPDHKAPSSARHILAMASEVEAARKKEPKRGPVIIHCSAGIGRTGCFIAISIGMIQLIEENCIDVLNTVCQMRLDRGGMVQTAEQYEFIYEALALYEASLPLSASAD